MVQKERVVVEAIEGEKIAKKKQGTESPQKLRAKFDFCLNEKNYFEENARVLIAGMFLIFVAFNPIYIRAYEKVQGGVWLSIETAITLAMIIIIISLAVVTHDQKKNSDLQVKKIKRVVNRL